ncbi:MAG: Hsp20/alpha crystallin family protein [Chitinophagales bacterium]|nr:Hsp20/alpha crystallin family protein [Chitinophagales bacterium]
MSLVKFKNNTSPVERGFNDLFNNFLNDDLGFFMKPFSGFQSPAVNSVETKDHFRLELAVPGFNKNDFSVKIEGNLLTVSGEKKNESNREDETFTMREFNHTSFSRSFTLPNTVDSTKISGEYVDGLLKIFIPKKEEAKQKPAMEVKIY